MAMAGHENCDHLCVGGTSLGRPRSCSSRVLATVTWGLVVWLLASPCLRSHSLSLYTSTPGMDCGSSSSFRAALISHGSHGFASFTGSRCGPS